MKLDLTGWKGSDRVLEFAASEWGDHEFPEPVHVMHSVSMERVFFPKKRSRKDRNTVVYAGKGPGERYPQSFKMVIGATLQDPVAQRLSGGEKFIKMYDEDRYLNEDERTIFGFACLMWYVLRRYRLIDGRATRAQAAKYGLATMRKFREGKWKK